MTEVFEVCEANFYNSLRATQKSLKTANPTILCTFATNVEISAAS